MGFFFNREKKDKGVEKVGFEVYSNEEYGNGEFYNEEATIRRKITLRILNTAIMYNEEESYYETIATCINENNEIETISIESFKVDEKVTEFNGAHIDYEEVEVFSEVECNGRIYKV